MEKKVKDVMVSIERCPTVPPNGSVKEAVAVLIKALGAGPRSNNTSILVMENNTLVGLLGLKEVLHAIEPIVFKGGTYRGWTVSAEWSSPVFLKGLFTEKCKELSALKVREIMAPVTRLINSEDTLIKAVHTLVSGGFEAVPVWQDNRVVGMVGSVELFDELAAIQLKNESGSDLRKIQAV